MMCQVRTLQNVSLRATRLGVDVDVDEAPDLKIFGDVDDYYAAFEWSEGGMIHAHMAFWIVGAPRIDKIDVPRLTTDTAVVEIGAAPSPGTPADRSCSMSSARVSATAISSLTAQYHPTKPGSRTAS